MRILITTGLYPPEIGGPATYTKLVEEELKKQGHTVTVLPFSIVRKYPTGVRHFMFLYKVFKVGTKQDIIYAQDTVSVGLPSLLASKILRKRFFVRVPGDFAWEQGVGRFGVADSIDDFQNKRYGFRVELLRTIQNFVVRGAESVVTPSVYFKKVVSKWTKDESRVEHIYNGISFEDVSPFQFARDTIVASGRLVSWKGFDKLISFIETTDFDLVIIGEGEEKDNLQNLIDSKNLQDRVKLLGRVSRKELLAYNKGSFAVVMPSTFESFSFQLVEAMSVGSVCIAFDIGNLNEIITNGVSGYLVPSGDFEAIRSVLHAVPNTRNIISQNAIQESKRFSIENTTEKLMKVFEKKRRLLMISTDRGLFNEHSHVTKRLRTYSESFDAIDVIVFTRSGFSKKTYGTVSVYPTNSASSVLYIFDAFRIALKIKKANIVTTQDPFETGIVGFLLSWSMRWNVQMHTDWNNSHFRSSPLDALRWCIAHLILWRTSSIRAVSERIRVSLPKYCLSKKVTVLPIIVEMNPFQNQILKKDSYYLLTVSRLEKEKNIDVLIRAMASVEQAILHIVGEGRERENLMNLVSELGLSHKVIFEGFHHDVSSFYKQADVYVQASSYEGFGMSLLEAGLHGLPIVTTDVGLVGFELPADALVIVKNFQFSEAIQKLLDDVSLREMLSEKVYEHATKLCGDVTEYYDKYQQTF